MSNSVSQPDAFDFEQPGSWSKWIRKFNRYMTVSGLDEKPEPKQVDSLIYCMGEKAEDILDTFKLSAEDQKKFNIVKESFDRHFSSTTSTVYERAKFNRRIQEPGESIDSFVTDLKILAKNCEFDHLHDGLIRDRIIIGCSDQKLSETLQTIADLTLDGAVIRARQNEAVQNQKHLLRASNPSNEIAESTSLHQVRRRASNPRPKGSNPFSTHQESRGNNSNYATARSRGDNRRHRINNYQANNDHYLQQGARTREPPPQRQGKQCPRCGDRTNHPRQACPAVSAICHYCNAIGHYAQCCMNRRIHEVQHYDTYVSDDEQFLGVLSLDQVTACKPWRIFLAVNDHQVKFKMDSGADVTAIPKRTYEAMTNPPALQKTSDPLNGPRRTSLPVAGKFTAMITDQDQCRHTEQEIFVIPDLEEPLLGRPALKALRLITLNTIESQTEVEPFNPQKEMPELFTGLGEFGETYTIPLGHDATPYSIPTPRRVPLPLMKETQAELKRMEDLGVISKVERHTEWCSPIVVVPKPNGKVRICVDLTKLNKSVQRELHMLPTVDHLLAQLGETKVMSKLDANSGYWQIPLAQESRTLTTFITPFGRYHFNRLPFGISSASEIYQKRMQEILGDLTGVICMQDDVLVYGKDQQEHDSRLKATLERIKAAGITLNPNKCKFSKNSLKFLGHVLSEEGLKPDPGRVSGVTHFPEPTDVSETRRFLGMVNQMGKFIPNLTEKTKPLRDLVSDRNAFIWGTAQQDAFSKIKDALCSAPVLSLYSPTRITTVSADASSYGLGAVLLQQQDDGKMHPVAYASRAMSETERRYAQIEKEALAITWACDRFSDYLIGLHFQIETDHKPLVPLLGSKDISELPARIQRFRIRLMRYTYMIHHVPGKELYTADALSRAITDREEEKNDKCFQEDTALFAHTLIQSLPASDKRLDEIIQATIADEVCKHILNFAQNGWPPKERIPHSVKPYWAHRGEITCEKGLLLYGTRILVPVSLRPSMLDKIHAGHQGITRCRQRARQSIWWPGLSNEIQSKISNCRACTKLRNQPPEPMLTTELPKRPWHTVGSDLFELKGRPYIIVVDYFSRYPEVALLASTTSDAIVRSMKSIFARHGIPEIVRTDPGCQYTSREFAKFAADWGFQHITNSPRYSQSNGSAEACVKTIKTMLKKADDPYTSMLALRTTPMDCGPSPSELLMGRRLRTNIPAHPDLLKPEWPDLNSFRTRDEEQKSQQRRRHNTQHRAKELPPLSPGTRVWIRDTNNDPTEGTVISTSHTPRSYVLQADEHNRTIRRNRRHLVAQPTVTNPTAGTTHIPNPTQGTTSPNPQTPTQPTTHPNLTVTRSGRLSKPPRKLNL